MLIDEWEALLARWHSHVEYLSGFFEYHSKQSNYLLEHSA
jgi:hypothetical protein